MFQQKKFGLPESLIKAVSEAVKAHTVPKTEKEKKLAALAEPKDKITHKDVMVGRGVLAKEEAGASKKSEEKFHMNLDKLVHKTFGHSPAEKKEKKMKKEEVEISEAPVDGVAAGSMEGDKHMCASKVMHKEWKEGTPLFSQHAEPTEDGYIEWYDVMFEHGIERVMTSDIEILVSESHMNHKKKKMKEEVELEEGNFHSIEKQKDGTQHVYYKDDFDKVKHIGTIHPPIRGSEGRYTAKHKDGKRMTPSSDVENLAKQLSRYHNKEFREDVESIDEKITVVPAGSPETGVQRIKTPSGGTITTGTVARGSTTRPTPSPMIANRKKPTTSSYGVTQRPDVTKNLSVKKEEIEHIEERESAEERIKGGRDKYRLGDKIKQSADHSLELKNLRHSLHMKKMQKYHEVETNSLENRKKRDDASTDHHIAYFKKQLERMDRDDDSHDANMQAIRDNMAARRKYMYGEEYESVPASKALQKAHDAERKKRGLPDPSYYLELIKKKKKEIEDMKKESVDNPPFTPDKPKKPSAVAGKFGIGYSTARHLARTGMQAALKDLKKGSEAGKRQVEEVELEEENAHIKLMDHHAKLAKEAAKKGYEFGNKNNRKKSEHFYALADKHVDASYAHEKAAKTNNPQHSKDAYDATKEVNKMSMREETELNELSKTTLGSYVKKASRDSRLSQSLADRYKKDKSRKPFKKDIAGKFAKDFQDKAWKREAGVNKAVDRLAKEEVEQVNELKTSTVQSYMQKRGDRQSRVATAIKDMETGSSKSKVHSAGLKRAAARMDKEEDKKRVPRKEPTASEIEKGRMKIPSWWTRGT